MSRRHSNAPKRTGLKVFALIVAAILAIGVAVAGIFVFNLMREFDSGRTVVENAFPKEEDRPAPPEPESDAAKAQNILLLGSDARYEIGDDIDEITGTRADAIMVLHIPAERDDIHVMSIMRDNWVPITGHGYNKINAALAFGGVSLMVDTVEKFIDSRIDHVAIIDFEGFKGLTDSLGGVEVTSAKAFRAGGHSFTAGTQRLNGDQALAFVRERNSFADGDYQRARNQQAYLKGLFTELLSRDTLTSPSTISDAVSSISPYLTVDEGLSVSYLAPLAVDMRNIRSADIRFFTSPTLGTGWEGTQSVVRPDWDRINELREHFRNDTLEEYEP